MMTLTEFLLARIAEDEAVAKAVAPLGHNFDMGGNRQDECRYVARLSFSSMDGAAKSDQDDAASQHFARHDPARVLAECEAKRRIVAEWFDPTPDFDGDVHMTDDAAHLFRLLALPYRDHPDYRDEWRP